MRKLVAEATVLRRFNAALLGALVKSPKKTADDLRDRVWLMETVKRDIDSQGLDEAFERWVPEARA